MKSKVKIIIKKFSKRIELLHYVVNYWNELKSGQTHFFE
jgi:hypothetical protein